jgi:hypothetical protein
MIPIIAMTIETCDPMRRPTASRGEVARWGSCRLPINVFHHREDSEPVVVAKRSRLAPTQPFPSVRTARPLPTVCQDQCSSSRVLAKPIALPSTFVASRCDLARWPNRSAEQSQSWELIVGRQAVGFRRTNGFDKNQRGVWEYLK